MSRMDFQTIERDLSSVLDDLGQELSSAERAEVSSFMEVGDGA